MFTVLKRIANAKPDTGDSNRSTRPTSMSTNLQKKFSKGVQYNMKIIIKGDKCSGKTSVFRRLQGKNLEEEYKPTEEIQVANIQWNYKNVEDVVKVEVWDVVDKGRKIIPFDEALNASLDAEFLDVYKGTNGVILVMDVTKNWTFSYVQNEIKTVPPHLSILVLGNRCDMGHHQKIPQDTVQGYIDSVQRPPDMGQIKYTESSMVNGFGLRYIYKFLALPFLQLQRSALICQLGQNADEIRVALQEIDLFQAGEDGDYDRFANQLSLKRRKRAEELGVGSKSPGGPSVIFGLGCPINRYSPFRKMSQVKLTGDPHQNREVDCKLTNELVAVEEFVPEDEQLENFFQDSSPSYSADPPYQFNGCSDSDSQEEANPLVAKFQEDLDPNDKLYAFSTKVGPPSGCDQNHTARTEGSKRGIRCFKTESLNRSRSTEMETRRPDPDPKETDPIDPAGGNPKKTTKKNRKPVGGKHSEGSDGDRKSSKSRRKKDKGPKEENRKSKKQMKNPTSTRSKHE